MFQLHNSIKLQLPILIKLQDRNTFHTVVLFCSFFVCRFVTEKQLNEWWVATSQSCFSFWRRLEVLLMCSWSSQTHLPSDSIHLTRLVHLLQDPLGDPTLFPLFNETFDLWVESFYSTPLSCQFHVSFVSDAHKLRENAYLQILVKDRGLMGQVLTSDWNQTMIETVSRGRT